jgi:TonB-linked SusC/RagA family outer membrane protein
MKAAIIPVIVILAGSGVVLATESSGQEVLKRKISIELKDKQMSLLLAKLEEVANIRFVYSPEVIPVENRASVNAYRQPLGEVLTELLGPYHITFEAVDNQVVLRRLQTSAIREIDKVVRGRVTRADNQALPGVSILIKGTTIGTTSDANGEYSLSIPVDQENSSLIFSFIGYLSQEIPIAGRTTIDVELAEDVTTLDEVVVVGYGSIKKSDLTNAISKIDGDAFEMQPLATLGEAFAGRLAGVRAQQSSGKPGAELQIRIRGINTITGNTDPLYVVDGIPRDNIRGMNPNDIASIQILKDASASSIYGSRGGNGIVLIETKQGSGKPAFNFESYFGFQQKINKLPMMNKDEFLAYHTWVRNEMWLRQGGSMKDPMSSRPAAYRIPDEWFDPARESTDWQDAITVTAPMQNYHLSTSAKSDLGSFYFSGGYVNQDGVIYNTYYRRADFRFKGELNVGDHMKIGANISPSFSNADDRNSEGKELVLHHAILQPPIVQTDEATRDWGYPPGLFLNFPNSLERLKETTNNTRENITNTSVWAQYEIVKGLTFKTLFNYDSRVRDFEYFQSGNVVFVAQIAQGSSSSSSFKDLGTQNTLTFDRTFHDHALNVLIGQSAEKQDIFNINAGATGWPNDLIPTLNVATTPTQASTTKFQAASVSFFGRTGYSFKDRYLLNASLRYDGSSRFGEDNRWGLFPSVSAGWKISNEAFLNRDWIDLLKIRFSWGKAGNDRIGYYDYMARLNVINNTWGDAIVSGLAPANVENQSLKWESTTTSDIGLDFSAFNNRVQLNVDYFNHVTDDLLFNVPVPNTSGFTSYRTNIGSIKNTGWEVDLSTINTTGRVGWSTSLNLSRTNNEVLDMGNITQFTETFWNAQFITAVGGPVSQFYVYRTNGLLDNNDFNSEGSAIVPILAGQKPGNVRYIDQNDDGLINSLDLVPYGKNLPDLIIGVTNTVEWKNFSLSVLLQGQIGGDVLFLGARNYDNGQTIAFNQFKRWLHGYKPDYEAIYGPGENPIPDINGVDMSWDGKTPYIFDKKFDDNSDFNVYDASFLRIKNVMLNYEIPKSVVRKALLQSAVIYASASNLITFDDYPGWNIEANNQGLTQQGVDYVTYPLSRTFILGARLTF